PVADTGQGPRRALIHDRRYLTDGEFPQRVQHPQPEPLRIALLKLHRHPGSTLGQAASPIHDRSSSSVFPLPAAADTSVTRAARPARPNGAGRETIPPLTAGTGLPPVPDYPARSMALAVNPRPSPE